MGDRNMNSNRKNQLFGYAGKQIRLNLSTEKISVETVDLELLKKYLGGVGYGAKLLYDELTPMIDPLSPENKLIFVTGPLTGTGAPGSGSVEVCFKSPLTGVWGEARSGGEWGPALRKAGYDFLIIEGRAAEPKYIVIDDDMIEIRSAEELKGKTSSQKEARIQNILGEEQFETVVIGPAGENLVRFACIMSGQCAFGRAGAGALMGSKNLLGIAVRGMGSVPVSRPKEFLRLCRECNRKVLSVMGKEGESIGGTPVLMLAGDKNGDIPTKNWRSNSWGKAEGFYNYFMEHNLIKADSCYRGCVLRCKRVIQVESGKWQTPPHKGSEYESLAAFTFFVLNEDMDAAVHADYLCNEYGLDTISTGGVIAFAMDCYNEDILNDEEIDGLDLRWGNADTIIKLIKKIANREGLGKLLGEGVRLAAKFIGKGSDKFAIHVKGLEGAAHDPRGAKSQAILYGTNNRGMCHMHPMEGSVYEIAKLDLGLIPYGLPSPEKNDRFSEENKAQIVKILQDYGIVPDILGICKFFIFDGLIPDDLARLLSALTGWEIDGRDLIDVGERVYDLQRKFNVREGITRKDDMLPERCLRAPEFGKYKDDGNCEIKNYEQMLTACYQARGWDQETGMPMDK